MVDTEVNDDHPPLGLPLTDGKEVKLYHDGIRAQLASTNSSYKPLLFAAAATERAQISRLSIYWGV